MRDLPLIKLDGVEPDSLVAVAMSGGVDSSVVAALMHNSGYQVIGVTLQLYDQGEMAKKKGACCAGQDIYDARIVADRLGFSHYVLDYENTFRQGVIDDFIDSYLQGETPIPCIRCNQKVKFKDLLQTAKDLGAKALVTGHYVRKIIVDKSPQLHRALDHNKDQSYFLFTTTKKQLDYLHFPLGVFSKAQTRQMAVILNLLVAEKPDSQDICFVPQGGYAQVVEKFRPGTLEPGEIIHFDGQVLGKHEGIINYTVGQRKGLKISFPEPLYVIKLNPTLHQVIVGPKEALATSKAYLKGINWLVDNTKFITPQPCAVKIRSSHVPVEATVQTIDSSAAVVNFTNPEYGVASGQACVFYDSDHVLGGGWITNNIE